jgi:FMN-dependent NADH-azoreductase
MKLLHIDSAITGESSVSRQLTSEIVARLRGAKGGADVTYRDLAAEPLGHLTLSDMPAPGSSTPILDEFLTADVIVVGAPMYNFTAPSQLKAWIDRILIAGKTFGYGENGAVGLVGDKRVIVAISRGGFYGAGSPAAANEHLETYLKGVFGFIGIAPEFIVAEGVMAGPEHRKAALSSVAQSILALAA